MTVDSLLNHPYDFNRNNIKEFIMIFYFAWRKAKKKVKVLEDYIRGNSQLHIDELAERDKKWMIELTEARLSYENIEETLDEWSDLISSAAPMVRDPDNPPTSDYTFVINKFKYGYTFTITGKNQVRIAHSQYYKTKWNCTNSIKKLMLNLGALYEPKIEDRTQ